MKNNNERVEENDSEIIEEQMSEALAMLAEKGYRVGSLAGDYGRMVDGFAEKQAIVFDYPLASEVEETTWVALAKLSVRRFSGAQPVGRFGIEFDWLKKTQPPEQLRNKWLEVAKVLPVVSI